MTEIARRPGPVAMTLSTITVAALVAASIVGELYAEPGPTAGELRLDIVTGVLTVMAVPALLRWPAPVAVALGLTAALSPAATPPATVGTLHAARTSSLRVAVAVAAAGVAGHLVRFLWRPLPGVSTGWYVVLVFAVHAALLGWGTVARARAALIASLAERARRAEAEQGRRVSEARRLERARIASEMHDVLAHRLSLVATYAGAVRYHPEAPPEQLARAAEVVRDAAHKALDDLRGVMSLLRDDVDVDAERRTRPQPTLADIPALVEECRRAGMRVQVDERYVDGGVPPASIGRTAYRVVREGLTNARTHAPGQPVRATLTGGPGDELVIEVLNPRPAGRPPAAPGSGLGLVGLTERVEVAGGRLEHVATADGEFRLRVRLPWPA